MKKVTFPHMGFTYVPVKVMFRKLGIELVVPPPCTARTLSIASKHSPEWVCIPYKLVLGNFIDGLEMGANVLIHLGGPNNCRFGYYSILHDKVLKELGYEFEMLTADISSRTVSGMSDIFKYLTDYQATSWDCLQAMLLAIAVLRDLDEIERKVQWLRPREVDVGSADKVLDAAAKDLSEVNSLRESRSAKAHYLDLLDRLPINGNQDPIKISIVGEIYVVHEPYINMNIEKELGRRGVEATRSEQVSQWLVLSPALILESLGIGHEERIARAARPFLEHMHGETVGQTVMAARGGFDGVIHLTPFTCTPEIVNENVLVRLRKDIDIPVLTLILDEQTGFSGYITRLEAFIDLLARRRQRNSLLSRHKQTLKCR